MAHCSTATEKRHAPIAASIRPELYARHVMLLRVIARCVPLVMLPTFWVAALCALQHIGAWAILSVLLAIWELVVFIVIFAIQTLVFAPNVDMAGASIQATVHVTNAAIISGHLKTALIASTAAMPRTA